MNNQQLPKILSDLVEGDEVIVFRGSYPVKVAKIEKITPSGFIRVDGKLYYKTGRLRGENDFFVSTIRIPTAKLREDVVRIAYLDIVSTASYVNLTTDQLARIVCIIGEKREL